MSRCERAAEAVGTLGAPGCASEHVRSTLTLSVTKTRADITQRGNPRADAAYLKAGRGADHP